MINKMQRELKLYIKSVAEQGIPRDAIWEQLVSDRLGLDTDKLIKAYISGELKI
jgi:hypothetical protein